MTMRDILQTVFAALILALGALWAFIVIGAYVRILFSGFAYVWHWLFH